jgi:hypothetical protein
MKKIYTLSLLLVGALSFGQFSDSFTGTGLLTANGWVKHSGTADQLAIVTGSLNYTGLTSTGNKTTLVSGNTEDANKASATSISGIAYYSAILNIPNTTGLNANTATGDYFLMNSDAAGATGVSAFSGRIYVRNGSAASTFNIGVLNNSGGTAAPSYVSTDYAVNTAIFVVVKYDLSTNTASLFVNPAIGSTEGTATVTNLTGTTAAPAQIAAIAIRQGGGTGNIEIDELRLGATWSSVTSGSLAVAQNQIEGLKIYPNPVTNGTFYINTSTDSTKEVVVYDVLGKQVVKTSTTNAVNVSNLKAGVYIVKIIEDGKTATRKLIIR